MGKIACHGDTNQMTEDGRQRTDERRRTRLDSASSRGRKKRAAQPRLINVLLLVCLSLLFFFNGLASANCGGCPPCYYQAGQYPNCYCAPVCGSCCPSCGPCEACDICRCVSLVPPGYQCCKGGGGNYCGNWETCCGNWCCPQGYGECCQGTVWGDYCCQDGGSCCPYALGGCCEPNKTCCGDHCCPQGHPCCGSTCCDPNQKCCDGSCCDKVWIKKTIPAINQNCPSCVGNTGCYGRPIQTESHDECSNVGVGSGEHCQCNFQTQTIGYVYHCINNFDVSKLLWCALRGGWCAAVCGETMSPSACANCLAGASQDCCGGPCELCDFIESCDPDTEDDMIPVVADVFTGFGC
jgi:hypothetical protein